MNYGFVTNFVRLLEDGFLSEPRSIVVIDNATIHHTQVIVDLIEATGAKNYLYGTLLSRP